MVWCLAAFPDFTWVVKANDRAFHDQFKKKIHCCLSKRKYADNAIKTAKYNILTFLPLNLYEQFQRTANLYFLFCILLQTVPEISTLPWFALLLPLTILLSIRGIRDLIDDIVSYGVSFGVSSLGLTLLAGGAPGKVTCEEPNSRMHSFVGTLEWRGEKYPLDSEQILLRGCRIRNTEMCYGLVIYAGFDSKIMKNCGKIKLKKTKLNSMMDQLVLIVSSSPAGSNAPAGGLVIQSNASPSPAGHAFLIFWGFVILLSLVIPMSMFEFIYLVNSCFINWDVEMYYPAKDMPAKARSTSLNDQLGQIEYVFSDKTGTLTQNIMTFKKCCINGAIYGNYWGHGAMRERQADLSWNKYIDKKLEFHDALLLETIRQDKDTVVREFLKLLALCHTVMVDEKDDQLIYQAASPDEEALVTAARNLGYVFLSRTQDTITISELGVERTYKVLAMLDFNSVRKRMSVLVRDPEDTIRLYTKGADTVILERLHDNGPVEAYTMKALDSFAEETLRTLCLASKEVEEEDYAKWSKKHYAASILLQNRAQELDKVYEEIEWDLKLLGATAIEDKLQDGVPETIQLLKRGDIKVWVLTGDKQETAVNIGFACQLLSDDMVLLEENQILYGGRVQLPGVTPHRKKALVVTGELLVRRPSLVSPLWGVRIRLNLYSRLGRRKTESKQDTHSLLEKAFVELATACQAVICCRVTPKQKALIVQLVKKHKNAIALAIGDGANDVNMIKTADIGVGISGQEGMQAVQCSDYALAQFCYLERLLLVHGRWSYIRICKFLRYFFYKTFAGMMVQIWFAFYNGFTGQPLYEGWFLALYNVFYTSCPVLAMGLLEQDVSAKKSLQFPELYKVGQKGNLFNYRIFFLAFVHGSVTSLINFYIALWALGDRASTRVVGDYQSIAVTVATSAMLYSPAPTECHDVTALCGPGVLCPSLSLRVLGHQEGLLQTADLYSDILSLQMQRARAVEKGAVELTSHIRRDTVLRHSSYAFSHQEGYAGLIARGASLRIKSSRNLQVPSWCSTHSSPLPSKENLNTHLKPTSNPNLSLER
uniref:Phospholipid-transporting ATPase n=1 Tax=Sphenodon punctatus TaxID=8508 RepID=A0A8D0HHX0_SPHPU